MKSYVALGLVTAMASTVAFSQEKQEQKFGFQLRLDNTSTYVKAGDADEQFAGQRFDFAIARFSLTGDVNDQIKYYVRVTNQPALKFDRIYVDYKPMAMLKVRAGQMQTAFGANENLYYTGFDVYTDSQYQTVLESVLDKNAQGVEFEVTPVADHKIALQILNAKDAVKGEKIVTLAYRGEVAKMVKPIFTYDNITQLKNTAAAGATAVNKPYTSTAYSLGAQVLVADAKIDVEYNAFNTKEDKDIGVAKDVLTGFRFGAEYDVKAIGLTPVLEYMSHSDKAGDADALKYTRTALAFEFRPTDKDFRYHVGYVMGTDQAVVATKTVDTKSRQYVLGTALKI